MSIKLMTNSINLNKGKSFAEIIDGISKKQEPQVLKTASAKTTKVAEKDEEVSSGQLDCEPLHQKGESEKPSAVNDKNKKTEVKSKEKTDSKKTEAASKKVETPSKKAEAAPKKAEATSKKEEDCKDDEEKDCKNMDASSAMDDKEASDNSKVVKIAKMNEKTRSMLRSYWSSVYPKEYVESMLAEQ